MAAGNADAYQVQSRRTLSQHIVYVNCADRFAKFEPDGDVFHENKAPVCKSVDKPLQAALKTDLVVGQPRAIIVIVRENVVFLAIALARRLPLPIAGQDDNSQRRVLSRKFDELERKIVELGVSPSLCPGADETSPP